MKRAPFIAANAPRWEAFEATLSELESRKRGTQLDPAQERGTAAVELAVAAQRQRVEPCVQDFSVAALLRQAAVPAEAPVLARQFTQAVRIELRAPLLGRIADFALFDFPARVRAEWRCVLLALALFALPFLVLWIGIGLRPDWVYYVLDGETLARFEEMYDPSAERLGRPSGGDAMMFGFYIRNNVGIAFRTFAGGLLLGLGSIFFLVYNGLMMGAVFGYLSSAGYTSTLYPFVIGHGSFELTAIVLAGAAGLKLGAALVAPGRRTRTMALLEHGRICAELMWGVFAMLVIAAFLEGFWSPSGAPAQAKYVVGALLWAGVLAYFLLAGRRRAR